MDDDDGGGGGGGSFHGTQDPLIYRIKERSKVRWSVLTTYIKSFVQKAYKSLLLYFWNKR